MPQFGNNPYQNPQMNQMGQGGQWNRQQTPTMNSGNQGWGGQGSNWWQGNNSGGGQNNYTPNTAGGINQGGWNNPNPTQANNSWGTNNTNQQLRTNPTTGYGNYIPPTQDTGQNPVVDPIDTTGTDPTGTTDPAYPAFSWGHKFGQLLPELATYQRRYEEFKDPKMGMIKTYNPTSGFLSSVTQGDVNAKRRQQYLDHMERYNPQIERWLSDQYRNVYGGDKEAMQSAMDEFFNSQGVRGSENFNYTVGTGGYSEEGQRENWRAANQGAWDYMQNLLGGIWGQ